MIRSIKEKILKERIIKSITNSVERHLMSDEYWYFFIK